MSGEQRDSFIASASTLMVTEFFAITISELAYAIASPRIFPTLKRALG